MTGPALLIEIPRSSYQKIFQNQKGTMWSPNTMWMQTCAQHYHQEISCSDPAHFESDTMWLALKESVYC